MEAEVCTILVLGNPGYPLLDLFSTVTYFNVKTWPRTARWDRTFMSTCGVACEDYGGNGTPPLSLLQPLSYNVKWRNRKCMSRYVLAFRRHWIPQGPRRSWSMFHAPCMYGNAHFMSNENTQHARDAQVLFYYHPFFRKHGVSLTTTSRYQLSARSVSVPRRDTPLCRSHNSFSRTCHTL